MYPVMPSWFREAIAEHVPIVLALNWDKGAADADYGLAAEKLWALILAHVRFPSPAQPGLTGDLGLRDICPIGQKEGKGHALTWRENPAYGTPDIGGLWSCYDCGGKLYTRLDGHFVEWTGP